MDEDTKAATARPGAVTMPTAERPGAVLRPHPSAWFPGRASRGPIGYALSRAYSALGRMSPAFPTSTVEAAAPGKESCWTDPRAEYAAKQVKGALEGLGWERLLFSVRLLMQALAGM